MMSEEEEPKVNPVVVDAIETLLKGLPSPHTTGETLTHGVFNRHMFLEAVVVKGGKGAAIDKEDIMRHGALTEAEFQTISEEWIAKGVVKEETNLFGVTLYSIQYDPIDG
jgi:hypothetical protein